MNKLIRRIRARQKARYMWRYRSAISNIQLAQQHEATLSTAQYVCENMYSLQSVHTWRGVHDIAIQLTELDGLVLEFGVFKGRTTNYIAKQRDWQVHGFDSFEGLPEAWRDGYPQKAFSINELPNVSSNVTLHKGWFEDTLPEFIKGLPTPKPPVAFLHIDCDLYSSTKTIFKYLGDMIITGTVIVFDEYFNYPRWEYGEFRAFQEFIKQNALSYEYLTYNHEHQQVAIRIT